MMVLSGCSREDVIINETDIITIAPTDNPEVDYDKMLETFDKSVEPNFQEFLKVISDLGMKLREGTK